MKNSFVKPRSARERFENILLSTFILEDSGHNYFQYFIVLVSEIQILAIFTHFSFHFFEDHFDEYLTFFDKITGFFVAELIFEEHDNPNFDGSVPLSIIITYYALITIGFVFVGYIGRKKASVVTTGSYILCNVAFLGQQIFFVPIFAVLMRMLFDYQRDDMVAFGTSQNVGIFVVVIVMMIIHSLYTIMSSVYNIHPFHDGNLLACRSSKHFALTFYNAKHLKIFT